MRTTRGMVQIVRSNNLILDTFIVVSDAVFSVVTFENKQVLDRELIILIPSDLQTFLPSLYLLDLRSVKQIENLFVVNLQERAGDTNVLILDALDLVEGLSDCSQ